MNTTKVLEAKFKKMEGTLKRLTLTCSDGTVKEVVTQGYIADGDWVELSPTTLADGTDGWVAAKLDIGKISHYQDSRPKPENFWATSLPPLPEDMPARIETVCGGKDSTLISRLFCAIYVGMANQGKYEDKNLADEALLEATRIAGRISLLEKVSK